MGETIVSHKRLQLTRVQKYSCGPTHYRMAQELHSSIKFAAFLPKDRPFFLVQSLREESCGRQLRTSCAQKIRCKAMSSFEAEMEHHLNKGTLPLASTCSVCQEECGNETCLADCPLRVPCRRFATWLLPYLHNACVRASE